MKTFCIYYPSKYEGTTREFTAEWWMTASSESAVRTLFTEESKKGNLDYPCVDISRIRVVNME